MLLVHSGLHSVPIHRTYQNWINIVQINTYSYIAYRTPHLPSSMTSSKYCLISILYQGGNYNEHAPVRPVVTRGWWQEICPGQVCRSVHSKHDPYDFGEEVPAHDKWVHISHSYTWIFLKDLETFKTLQRTTNLQHMHRFCTQCMKRLVRSYLPSVHRLKKTKVLYRWYNSVSQEQF